MLRFPMPDGERELRGRSTASPLRSSHALGNEDERSSTSIEQIVREAGLRPTRQRMALARLLFAKGDRHLSAEELHEEALAAGVAVSLATVYNALHQFTDAGLLRILAVEGARTYFDTNTSDHHHFFVEGEKQVMDICGGSLTVAGLPEPPEGTEIANIDVIVRLRRSNRSGTGDEGPKSSGSACGRIRSSRVQQKTGVTIDLFTPNALTSADRSPR